MNLKDLPSELYPTAADALYRYRKETGKTLQQISLDELIQYDDKFRKRYFTFFSTARKLTDDIKNKKA